MTMFELWNAIRSELIDAALSTLEMATSAFALGVVLGFLVALMRMSRGNALRRVGIVYIEVLRGTPALVQLFVIYFSLPMIGVRIESFQAAVIGLGLNTSAYMAEVFRAGIEWVPAGQRDASRAIGMRKWQAMRWIILPQTVRVILPPTGNIAISLLKDTSVASLIAAPDLLLRAQDLSAEYFMPLEIYTIVGAMYFMMCFPLSLIISYFERRSGIQDRYAATQI